MTSVISLGPSQLQSWMVSKLFGSQSASASSSPSNQPGISVGASGSGVSGQTLSAISALSSLDGKVTSNHDSGVTPKTSGNSLADYYSQFFIPGAHNKSITQSNDIIKANQALTSDQVNAAMYGNGIATAGMDVETPNTTFSRIVNDWQANINDDIQRSQNESLSDSDRKDALDSATWSQTFINSISKAYENKTLKFQKASDIDGLDFSESVTFLGSDPNKAADIGVVGSQTYNHEFYENRTNKDNSAMLDIGSGLTLYLTW